MTSRIARKEFIDTLRDGRFRVLAIALVALALVAMATGWRHYRDVQRQHDEASRATRAQWLNQGQKNPHSAAHYGVYAFKPKSRLSMVDAGIDPYVGVAAWLEAHKQNEFKFRPAQDRTALQRFGELTAAESMLVLVPLFIVLVGFNAISGEREQGTLRQLLSLGVAPGALMRGKMCGLGAALGLVVTPVAAIGGGALLLTADLGSPADDVARLGWLIGLFLGYFAIWAAIVLGVSARSHSSRQALTVLLGCWFVVSLIAPRVAADVASVSHPTPSAVAFQAALDADLADQSSVERRLAERRTTLLQQYGAATMAAVPVDFSGISLQEGEEHGNEVFDRHFGRLFALYEQQNALQTIGGLLAPVIAMRALSMGLAATDFWHHRAFIDAAESYRRQMQRTLNQDIVEHARPGTAYLAGADLWERIPPFRYAPPPAGAVLGQHRLSLFVLAAWLLAAMAFALSSVRRLTLE